MSSWRGANIKADDAEELDSVYEPYCEDVSDTSSAATGISHLAKALEGTVLAVPWFDITHVMFPSYFLCLSRLVFALGTFIFFSFISFGLT